MTDEDVHEMCHHFNIDPDDTMMVLFKRGEYNDVISRRKMAENQKPEYETTINDESQFSETERNR